MVDIPTILFIGIGLSLLFIPLNVIASIFRLDKDDAVPYASLLVPTFGFSLLFIGFVSYHKYDLRKVFFKACNDLDRTNIGKGIGSTLAEGFGTMFANKGGNGTGVKAMAVSPTE